MFHEYWNKDSDAELYHFIGKDILYFHALFWPAMLEAADYRTPSKICAHGFLTVDGAKMSKSRGTFITAESYLQQGLNPEWLRYYFAAKLNGTMEDIDLSFDDFVARVNSDLIGKYVNIASRCAGFINKKYQGKLGSMSDDDIEWLHNVRGDELPNPSNPLSEPQTLRYSSTLASGLREKDHGNEIRSSDLIPERSRIYQCYEERNYGRALRLIMQLADLANQYVDRNKPWEIAKKPGMEARLHDVCTTAINMFHALTIFLKPVLPNLAEEAQKFLGATTLNWSEITSILADGHQINKYQHLMTRIDTKQIEALVAANKENMPKAPEEHSRVRHAESQQHAVPPSPSGRGAGGEGNRKAPLPPEIKEFARKLRHEQTDAESLMWLLLRDRRLGSAKFRRQHPVDPYVLDFYCNNAKLAIEVDGGQHGDARTKDEQRTAYLKSKGIEVLRFWDNEVLKETEAVLEKIWEKLMTKGIISNEASGNKQQPSPPAPLPEGEGGTITIDDFTKIDLRIAKIVNAEHVEGADKLLQLTLDIGEEQTRNVFAGIKSAYEPEQLIGRHTVMVANLAPRKMKFGMSEGMVLAAGPGGKELWILSPDDGAQPGMRVK